MSILGWVVVGFVAGLLAKAVTGTRLYTGCIGTTVIGVLGGLLGGALFNLAGDDGIDEFGWRSLFVAFIGACVLLLVVGLVARRDRRVDG